jgi:hypothetical protein
MRFSIHSFLFPADVNYEFISKEERLPVPIIVKPKEEKKPAPIIEKPKEVKKPIVSIYSQHNISNTKAASSSDAKKASGDKTSSESKKANGEKFFELSTEMLKSLLKEFGVSAGIIIYFF